MNIKHYTSFIGLMLLFAFSGLSADYQIVFYSGKVNIIRANGKTELLKAVNVAFRTSDVLELFPGSEVYLSSADGKVRPLANTGYQPVKLNNKEVSEKLVALQDKSIMDSMMDFMSEQLSDDQHDLVEYSEKHLHTRGGVSRSECTPPVMLVPAYGEGVHTNVYEFRWNAIPGCKSYQLAFFNDYELDSFQETGFVVEDTVVSIDLSAEQWIKEDQDIFWVVYPENQPNCARYNFKVLSAEVYDSIMKEADAYANTSFPNDNCKAIALASFYENRGLIDMAQLTYKNQMTNSRDQQLLDMYKLFVYRNSVVE